MQPSATPDRALGRLENGFTEARPSTIRRLAAALGVEPEELVKIRGADV